MKKMITIIAMAIFIIILNAVTVNAADGDYTYEIHGDYAVITGYTGSGEVIEIPENIGGYAVRVIGAYTFSDNASITKLTMPDTVVELEREAFADCKKLKEIHISKSLQIVGQQAFAGCLLLEEINLPSTLAVVGPYGCFSWCPSLTAINVEKEERLQNGFFSIDGVLFYNGGTEVRLIAYPGNKQESEYTIPDFVSYIRYGAFSAMQNLKKLVIPVSVNYFESSAISGTESKYPIDIIFKHDSDAPGVSHSTSSTTGEWFNGYSFSNLASGSRLICRTETIRAAMEKGIYNKCATAVLASEENAFVPAESLTLTSPSKITLNPETSTYVSWSQTPANTTDNVTWESSDPTGLTIEPHTGRTKAIYRGSYIVTGKDESNHEISAQVTVSTKVADVSFSTWTEGYGGKMDVASLEAGNPYILYAGFDLVNSGTNVYREDTSGFTSAWSCSCGKCTFNKYSESFLSGVSYNYIPASAGAHSITYACKDGQGEVVAEGKTSICVLEGTGSDNSNPDNPGSKATTFSGTTSYINTFGENAFILDMKVNASQALQYASSNTSVATVTPAGKVSIKGAGTTNITVSVSGVSGYTDAEQKVTVKVNQRSVNDISIDKVAEQPYTGKAIKPSVKAAFGGSTLKLGTDYTVSYGSNSKVGAATITVTGINNFSGSRKETFQIVNVGETSSLAQKTGGKTTTTSIQLTWKKASGVEGYQIYRSTKKNSGYRNVATISKGSTATYTDKKLKVGTTYYYKIRAFRKISGATKTGSYSGILAATTKPAKVSLKLKSGNKKAILSWKPVKGATGYEIYRSTSKNGKYSKIKTLAKGTTKTYTDGKVTAKKTYFYKVQANRTVDGIKINSGFSNAKNVKVK